MSNFQDVQDFITEIDSKKVKSQGKRKSHHLVRICGTQDATEYAVCTDETEIPYTKYEEQKLVKLRFAAFEE